MKLSKNLTPHLNKNRIQHTDLAPDGVRIVLDWGAIEVGSSIFIPAVNVVELIVQFQSVANSKHWTIEHRVRIENGKWGVRFWRML